jgi:cytochrome c oxidase subunit IV
MTDIVHTDADTATDSHAADGHDAHDHHGPTDKQFITVFFILAAITAVEVAVSYLDIGAAFLPVLLALMVVKFFTVVLYFMHVKFDAKIFGQLFYIGLGLAVGVYIAALATFQFFAG